MPFKRFLGHLNDCLEKQAENTGLDDAGEQDEAAPLDASEGECAHVDRRASGIGQWDWLILNLVDYVAEIGIQTLWTKDAILQQKDGLQSKNVYKNMVKLLVGRCISSCCTFSANEIP
jgi:hypothetical protein